MAILQRFSELSMLAFVISSMLAMGISQPLQDVIAPLKNPKTVLTALLVNFVLAPLLAIGLTRLMPLVVLLVGLLVGLNLETMAGTLRTFAIPAAAIYVLGMAGIGHLLGGADASKRVVSALCAGNRNFAVALLVAAASFEDPAITVMLLVTSITGLVLLLMVTRLVRPTVAV